MNRIFEDWKNKRVFKIERDRYKHKKYIFTPFVNTMCQGFNNKNLFPYLVVDSMSKFFRMQGENVMLPIGFNNLNEESLNYSRLRGDNHENLKEFYHRELCDMAVGFDSEKEISYSDKNFSSFVQLVFNKLYTDGFIKESTKECFVDFSNHIITPKYRVKEINGEFYDSITEEKLRIKKCKVLSIDLAKINIFNEVNSLNLPNDIKDKIYDILECKKGLAMNLYSYEKDMGIEVYLNDPELMAGISFIAVNPSKIDITPYVTDDERDTIEEYLAVDDQDFDCYTGLSLKNPLTNTDIYVFASYKYDEPVHVGLPFNNMLDGMFASRLGLESINVLEDDILINSDFLDGMTRDVANKALVEAFTSEGMGSEYLIPCLEEIVITSYDELGILVPMYENYKGDLLLFPTSNYPIHYTSRYKIFINNENSLDSNMNPIRMVFNEDFIRAISNIYARVYDYNVGNNDFFTSESIYDDFFDMVGVFDKKTAYIDVFYNAVLNGILRNYGKNYPGYSKIILLDDLEIDHRFLEEHQRLGVSFVEEIINRYDCDSYRLYLFSENNYFDDLGDTINAIKKYSNLIEKIKDSYNNQFEQGVIENREFIELKNNSIKLLNDFNVKEYSRLMIDFFNEYVKPGKINKNEAFEYLIMLSIICPCVAEEIYANRFNERYSIFYSEFPR